MFLLGLLFGFGLIISGMIYPSKVIGFLNITNLWDPSLAFVMVGGISVYSIFYFLYKDKKTFLGYEKNIPKSKIIDTRLIFGAVLFGAGWGMYGYCPAPALVGLGLLNVQAIFFVFFMIVGMYIFEVFEKARK